MSSSRASSILHADDEVQEEEDDDDCSSLVLSILSLKACSKSILLDHCKLPPPKPTSKTVLLTQHPSPDTAAAPPLLLLPSPSSSSHSETDPFSASASASSRPRPRLYRSVSSLGSSKEDRISNACNVLSFAPLPEGKSRRSNSITLGVAARAKMIQSQGGGAAGGGQARQRYSGAQVWYQPGGSLPPDVYTYKDATAAISKAWGKFKQRRNSSSASSASATAASMLAMEKEGKAMGSESIEEERIEDVVPHPSSPHSSEKPPLHDVDHIMEEPVPMTVESDLSCSEGSARSESVTTPTDELRATLSTKDQQHHPHLEHHHHHQHHHSIPF